MGQNYKSSEVCIHCISNFPQKLYIKTPQHCELNVDNNKVNKLTILPQICQGFGHGFL